MASIDTFILCSEEAKPYLLAQAIKSPEGELLRSFDTLLSQIVATSAMLAPITDRSVHEVNHARTQAAASIFVHIPAILARMSYAHIVLARSMVETAASADPTADDYSRAWMAEQSKRIAHACDALLYAMGNLTV